MTETDGSTSGLTAAILIGGRSRRMGQDKALLRLQDDGPTVIEVVAEVVRSVATEVFLVGGRDDAYDFLDIPTIKDIVPEAGALGGIHAALSTTGCSHMLAVACDMPFLNANLLRFMRDLPHTYDVLVPVLDQPHPLHAIYASSCLPAIERRLQVGNNRVMGWWSDVNIRTIPQDAIAQYDPALGSVFNMNTLEDLAMARAVIRESANDTRGRAT